MKKLICLLLFNWNFYAFADAEEGRLNAFLKANNLPADTIEQIAKQEFKKVRGNFLTPQTAFDNSNVELKTVQQQFDRISHAHNAIGISAALLVAGVVCFVVPIPGSTAVSIILIKQGVAVAVTVTAVAAAGSYTIAKSSEETSLIKISDLIKTSLNQIFAGTAIEQDIGKISDVEMSRRDGIRGFHTSKGFEFKSRYVRIHNDLDLVFISYNHFDHYVSLYRWSGGDTRGGKVISLLDFAIYPIDAYLLMRRLETKQELAVEEQIQLAQLISYQLDVADVRRKREAKIDEVHLMSLRLQLGEILNLSNPEVQGRAAMISEILQSLLEMRARL